MPADVVRRVQGAAGVAGDQDRLADDVDDRDPPGPVEPEVGDATDAEPLAVEHPVALERERLGVDVHLARQRGLQGHHALARLGGRLARRDQVAGAVVAVRVGRQRPAAASVGTGRRRRRPRRRPAPGSAGGSGSPAGCGSGRGSRLAARPARAAPSRARRTAAPGCRGAGVRPAPPRSGPASTIRPRYMTAIRSAMFQARPRSWVTTRTPRPSSSRSLSSSARISPRIEASRLETGSSAISRRGSSASAPAISTRCR